MKRLLWGLAFLCCLVGTAAAQDDAIKADDYDIITPDNISQARFIGYLGAGWGAYPVWSADNKTVFINTSTGQWRYDVTNFDAAPTFGPYPPLYDYDGAYTSRTNLDGVDFKSIAISPDRQYGVELIQEGLPESFLSIEYKVSLVVYRRDTGAEVTRLTSDAVGGRTYSGRLTLPTFGVLGLTYFRDGALYRWSPETKLETLMLTSEDLGVDDLVYSPDARYLITVRRGGLDSAPIRIRFWDMTVAPARMPFEKGFFGPLVPFYSDSINVDFSPDGKTLIESQHSYNVRIWDLASRGMIYRDTNPEEVFESATHHVVYSPDGRYIAGCQIAWSDYAFLRDTTSGENLAMIDAGGSGLFCEDVLFHPAGKDLLIVTDYGTVEAWPIATLLAQKEVSLENTPIVFGSPREQGMPHGITASLNVDGTTLGIAYDDGTIHLWDYATHNETMVLNNDSPIRKLLLDPSQDGRLITGDDNGSVILWDLNTVKRTILTTFVTPSRFLDEGLFPLVMNEQGTLLFAVDGTGQNYVWDTENWELRTFKGSMPMAFSPDGRFMATIGSGGDVALYGVRK